MCQKSFKWTHRLSSNDCRVAVTVTEINKLISKMIIPYLQVRVILYESSYPNIRKAPLSKCILKKRYIMCKFKYLIFVLMAFFVYFFSNRFQYKPVLCKYYKNLLRKNITRMTSKSSETTNQISKCNQLTEGQRKV